MSMNIQRSLSRGLPARAPSPLLPVCSNGRGGKKKGSIVVKITVVTVSLALCVYGAFAFVFLGKADRAVARGRITPELDLPQGAAQQGHANDIHSRLAQAREVARRSQLEHEQHREHATHGNVRHEATEDLRHVAHSGVHVRRSTESAQADPTHLGSHQPHHQQADSATLGIHSASHDSQVPADVLPSHPHLEEAHRQRDWDRAGVHQPGVKARGVIEAPDTLGSQHAQRQTEHQHQAVHTDSTAQHAQTQGHHDTGTGASRQLEVEQVTPELIERERLFEHGVFGSHPTDEHHTQHSQSAHHDSTAHHGSSTGQHHVPEAVVIGQTQSPVQTPARGTGVYALSAADIDGHIQPLSQYMGKVSLIVNVASQCGYTDENYKGLQATYVKYKNFGLEILAFPCNQFGAQEPGSGDEIKHFCSSRYQVTFPLFSKIEVNGPHEDPIFTYLKQHAPAAEGGGGGVGAGEEIGWNFYKFLVGKDGRVLHRWNQRWNTGTIEKAVYEALTAS